LKSEIMCYVSLQHNHISKLSTLADHDSIWLGPLANGPKALTILGKKKHGGA
jgi:hypothetical protein